MKKLCFLIVFFFNFGSSRAQGYVPFAVEGAHWTMYIDSNYDMARFFPLNENHCCFKINGDTVIGSASYKKLYESSTVYECIGFNGVNCSSRVTLSGNWQLIKLVREDTIARKVYCRNIAGNIYSPAQLGWNCQDSTDESLLYDFSVGAGDSIFIHYVYTDGSCQSAYTLVDSVGSTFIYGLQRTIWHLHGWPDYYPVPEDSFSLIEGIGYSFGIFGSPMATTCCPNYTSWLSGYCVGPDSLCGSCYTWPAGIQDISPATTINIYPSPASNYVTIGSNEIIEQVTITDISGKLILTQNCNTNKITLALTGISPGLYICSIHLPDGEVNRLITIN